MTLSDHTCDGADVDKRRCPDPCNARHAYCSVCGKAAGPCAHVPEEFTAWLTSKETVTTHQGAANG